ncbi:MAG: DUF805 domain-containing protein [Erythrobacter sp.]
MLEAIKYNLANLTNFAGRDARQTFWYYMLFLVVLQFGVGIIIAIPMYVAIFSNVFDAVSSGADPDAAMGTMVADMTEHLSFQVMASSALAIFSTVLFLAAFVRRLHDAGFSGWIAAIPVATQIFSVVYNYAMLDVVLEAMAQSMNPANQSNAYAMQLEVAPWSVVGYIGYLVVIIFGVLKSQDGPNKYGDEPVRY